MAEDIQKRLIEEEMKESYVDYAMSVIVGRALPDVRDGLKPVHRRVLFTMLGVGLLHNKPFKKSANIVGNCMAKYHPHGDAAIYDTLVRLAQDFSMRYPLVNGQGNFGCFTKDTKIRLSDGSSLSFAQLIKEQKKGKKHWTFSYSPQLGNIEISEIKNPRLTRKNERIVELTLDNGEKIKCTFDHRFMLRNGSYKKAIDLKPTDSLMPLYTKLYAGKDKNLIGYETVWQPTANKWEFVHRLADEWNLKNNVYKKKTGRIRHHKDFNKLNNNPDNIIRIQWQDPKFREKIVKSSRDTGKRRLRENPDYMNELAEKAKLVLRKKWRDPTYKEKVIKNRILGFVYSLTKQYPKVTPKIFEEERRNHNHIPRYEIALNYFSNFQEIVKAAKVYNHKVISVRILQKRADVYDITVMPWHNFALSGGIFVHNSIDGDAPAASRYTEARLTRIAEELLADINKETVDFVPNYDGSTEEPIVLPVNFPNLLVNGSSGIAVGMATNIPPHNITEVAEATLLMIDNPDISVPELMGAIRGPDFPTGAIICGRGGIRSAYETGKGKLVVRAKVEIEEKKDKEVVIIKDIPYMVNKTSLLESMANLVNNKVVEGVTDIRDESDREGLRIVVELRKGTNHNVVLNQLFKHTQLQTTFGVIMLALHDGQPKLMGLKEVIHYYLEHRKEVITRRTKFDLKKAEERAHILEGLKVALNAIDTVVKLIKAAKTPVEAKTSLVRTYQLSDLQAQAILDMKLQRLTSLEQTKLKEEHDGLIKLIYELKEILASKEKILSIIKKELIEIKQNYGDKRRTEIAEAEDELEVEDLIPKEDVLVMATKSGYIKKMSVDEYQQQRRGGKGVIGTEMKEDDVVEQLLTASTHSQLLFFSNKGKIRWLKAYNIPTTSRHAKGKAMINLLDLEDGERINTIIPIKNFDDKHFLIMVTKKGLVKKTPLMAFAKPRKVGIIAINLREGDELVQVRLTPGNLRFILGTKNGLALKFDEKNVRPMGRNSAGVRGVRLGKGDEVVGVEVALEIATLFTITENGYGKRTKIPEYRLVHRGGKGIINIKTTERNGKVVGIKTVMDKDEVIVTTVKGVVIRLSVKDISCIGRNTQGVRIMKLNEGDKAATIARVINYASP